MQIEGLSWFPGHMTKTKRMIVAEIKNVDAVCEILDARIPLSSRNPDVDEMTTGKPRLVVLNRVDTPGILWPKFDDVEVGKCLAFTGAIKDDVMDIEELACYLMEYLGRHYADILTERYKIDVEEGDTGYDLLTKAGRKRGFLMRGAEVDTERMARILLDEFRGGKLGRFTLETVEEPI